LDEFCFIATWLSGYRNIYQENENAIILLSLIHMPFPQGTSLK